MISYTEPAAEYHGRIDAISNSKLGVFLKRPSLYRAQYIDRTAASEPTDAMQLGTALHCAVLEPTRWQVDYCIAPKCDRRTKEGKAAYAAFIEANAGKQVLDADDTLCIDQMAASVHMHPIASALLGFGKSEVTIRRESKRFGLTLQCRLDWLGHNRGELLKAGVPQFAQPYYAVDLKSCSDLDEFRGVMDSDGEYRSRNFHRFGYARQQAFYQHVAGPELGPLAFFFVAVESKPPFDCAVFTVPNDDAETVWQEIDDGLQRLKQCLTANEWPSGFDGITEIRAPKWAKGAA